MTADTKMAPTTWVGAGLGSWARFVPLVAVFGALVVLILRRPATVLVAEFWADDGPLFTHALDRGVSTLGEQWGASLILGERVVYLAATWVPPVWAPVLANVVALVVTALVAAFLALRLPLDRWRSLGIAGAFLLLPGSDGIVGTISHLQWVTGAFLIAYPFATRQRHWELAPLALAGVTGPQVLFAWPLYLGRWWRDRSTWPTLTVVSACAALQVAVIATSSRARVEPEIALIPETLVTRLTFLPWMVGLIVLALLVAASFRLPRPVVVGLWFVAIAIPVAGLMQAPDPTRAILTTGVAPRYFWLSTAIFAALVIASKPSLPRTACLVIFVLLFGREVFLPPHPVAGWAEQASCIGGSAPCMVPVEPRAYWGDNWAVRWTPD